MRTHRFRPGSFVSVALLVAAGMIAAPAALAQAPLPTAPPTAAAPSCHTVDSSGQPATLFAPGDRVVVEGEGFGLVSALRITFVQGARTLPVAVAYSDELGVFSTSRTEARIPGTAAPGPGSIHAFSTTKVATCAVQIMAAAGGSAASPKPHKKTSRLVLLWWAALAVFGLFLVIVVIRRWRARRLVRKVADQPPAPAPVPADEADDDVPVLETGPPPLAIGPEPVNAPASLLAPVIDEPRREPEPFLSLMDEPPPPAEVEAPVLDLLPDSGPDLEPESILPPSVPPPEPSGGDELE